MHVCVRAGTCAPLRGSSSLTAALSPLAIADSISTVWRRSTSRRSACNRRACEACSVKLAVWSQAKLSHVKSRQAKPSEAKPSQVTSRPEPITTYLLVLLCRRIGTQLKERLVELNCGPIHIARESWVRVTFGFTSFGLSVRITHHASRITHLGWSPSMGRSTSSASSPKSTTC